MVSRSLPPAFGLLVHQSNAAADAALVEVLPELDPETQAAAFAILVGRGDVPSLSAMVGRFNVSGRVLQSLILEHVRHLSAAVRRAIVSPQFEERAGAIEVIVRSETGELAYLLADALRSRCARTRELSAAGLHEMTARCLERPFTDSPTDSTSGPHTHADYLGEALQAGVMTWEIHLQPKVLEAAAWMADRVAPGIREKLKEPRTKIARALNDLLAGTLSPRLAGFAVHALAIPALRASAARAIGRARDSAFIRAVLAEGWLLTDAEIRRGCRWIRDSRWLHRGVDELLTLEGQEAVTAVSMIEATGGPHEGKVELYHELLGVGDDDLRRAVVWQLVADRSEAATDLLAMVAGRRSDDLARIADCELRRRRPGGGTEPAGSDTRADAAVDPPARRAFERLWEGYSEDSPPAGSELPHAIRVDGSDFLILLRAKLASARPVDRTRALCIARDLDLLVELQEQVYRLAHDPDPVVRSLAVGLLADLPGPTSQRILRIAVQDADPRVQANAIEALDKLDLEERIPATTAYLDSPHARVRANAVKSLLRVELEKAGEVLLDMLEDSSRAHRLSALWVVGRLQLRAVLLRVDDLSRNDSDERVRRRAGRIVHDLGRIGGVGRERPALSANPIGGRRVGGTP